MDSARVPLALKVIGGALFVLLFGYGIVMWFGGGESIPTPTSLPTVPPSPTFLQANPAAATQTRAIELSIIATAAAPTAVKVSIPPALPTTAPQATIIYTVTGSAGVNRASLTYQNEQGGTEQADVALPWTKTLMVPSGAFVYLSAQNISVATGGITCEITANRNPFKRSQSSGQAAIASCSGSAP